MSDETTAGKEIAQKPEPNLIKTLRKEAAKAFSKFDKAQADYIAIVKMAEASGYSVEKGEMIKFV